MTGSKLACRCRPPVDGGCDPAKQYGAGRPAYGIFARAPTLRKKGPRGTGVVIIIENLSGRGNILARFTYK